MPDIEDFVIYWCCPYCGLVFSRTSTSVSNTIHYCPAYPGCMVEVEEPDKPLAIYIAGHESSTKVHP